MVKYENLSNVWHPDIIIGHPHSNSDSNQVTLGCVLNTNHSLYLKQLCTLEYSYFIFPVINLADLASVLQSSLLL